MPGSDEHVSDPASLKREIKSIARKIDVADDDLPNFGQSRDFGYPHIEIDSDGYHYVVVERGQELSRKSTRDSDELFFWIFESITFSMACDHEVSNRIDNQDFRRLLFRKQLNLLGKLKDRWKERCFEEISRVLTHAPFDDEIDGPRTRDQVDRWSANIKSLRHQMETESDERLG